MDNPGTKATDPQDEKDEGLQYTSESHTQSLEGRTEQATASINAQSASTESASTGSASTGSSGTGSANQDQLIRATAADGQIRVVGVVSTQTAQEASRRHKLSYVGSVALSRAMSAGLLLAANLKVDHARLSLKFKGDGPLGQIWVDAGCNGTVRGYVTNPAVELPLTPEGKLNVAQAVGQYGYLHTIRDEGVGTPFTSTVELVSGEIGDDVTRYLASSEQTPSIVLLGAWVNTAGIQAAGGILIQMLPDASPTLIPELEQRLAGVEEISPMLAEGKHLPEILNELLSDLNLKILPGVQPVQFQCKCSASRVKGALRMLGTDELTDMIEKDGGAEVTCHFCSKVYKIGRPELERMVKYLKLKKEQESQLS